MPAREPWTTGGSTVLKTPSPGAKQHAEDDKGSRSGLRGAGSFTLPRARAACAGIGRGWVHADAGGVGNTL